MAVSRRCRMKMINRNRNIVMKKYGIYVLTASLVLGSVSAVGAGQVYAGEIYSDGGQEQTAEETAASAETQEEQAEVIHITTVDEFIDFANNCYIDSWSMDKRVELDNDLDFTGRELVMVPVFDGYFEGNGHTISGIDFTGEGYVTALFRYVEESGVINSLNVRGNITASDEQECVGGIAGSNYGTIKNCTFEGTVGGKRIIGGIAAFNKNTGIIKRCRVYGRITGSYYTGGITGINHGIITSCSNGAGINDDSKWVESEDENSSNIIGSITGSDESTSIRSGIDAGGISGFSDGIIADCKNTGQIGYEHVGYNIGGIAGRQSGIVSACVNAGKVYGRKDVGGIVGQMEPYIEVVEAETIRNTVDELHDLIDLTFDDLTDSKNIMHDDFTDLINHADRAVDVGHVMADEVSTFANSNLDQLDIIVERIEYVSDSMPAVFDSMTASMDSINNMANWIKRLNDDLNVQGKLDANPSDKEQYDAAVKKIEDAIDRFNDTVKNSSRQEIDDILKDEDGNYKNFSDLTEDDLKAVVESVVDILKNAEDMSQAAGDIMDGVNTIVDILKPYFDNAADAAKTDIDNAVNEMQNAVTHTKDALNGIKGIFTYLNAQSDVRFTRLSADFDTHRNELYNEVKSISASLTKLNDDMSGSSDVVNADLKAVNDKVNEVFNLIIDKVEAYTDINADNLYNDVSDEEIDEETTGRVDGCSNMGDVAADINVGGIAGAMAIDTDDLEDNAAGKTDITLGSRYLTKCVINDCRNDGYIASKKDGAGGIAGYMKLGIIRESKSFGSVKSSDGGYAGGICGQSLSMIVDSYSLCSVSANKYVGGIAGYGNIIRDCYSMVNLEAVSGRVGAIAGQTTAYEDEEEENDEKVTGNFYVDNGVHGIDGISYTGVAQPITYDELLKVHGVPMDFRQLKVTYRVDDTYVGRQTLAYGTSLTQLDFPDAPKKDGFYVVWPDMSDDLMTGNIVVNGEYRNNVSAVASAETDKSGKPYAIVSGEFTEETTLSAISRNLELPEEAHMKEYVVYDISLADIPEDTPQELAVRLLNPYSKMKLYTSEDGVWNEADYTAKGSYAQTALHGATAVFCLVNAGINPMIYVASGTAAASLLLLVIIIKLIKAGKKRRNKRKPAQKENDNDAE